MSLKRQKLVISQIIQETTAAKTFVLRSPDDSPMPYQSGQFLTFIFETQFGEERRNYSISSSVAAGDPLSITVKRVVNGTFSRKLIDQAKTGDILTTIGASGRFVLPQRWEQSKEIFFLAAGSGITPVFSLIKTILFSNALTRVVLIYSNRSESDAIFRQQIIALQRQFEGRFRVVWLFSSIFDRKLSRLNNVLLKEILEEQAGSKLDDILFYLCGPHDYMRMIHITLLTLGARSDQVRKEEFVTTTPVPPQMPPDLRTHYVQVQLNGKRFSFSSGYPLTILDAGLKSGHELPFSCKTGRCGTCAAYCTRGQVWMAHNEVLTGADLSKGLILTCTAYPVDGPVTLDFDTL
jgi:ferredoxin-NADP reductase